MAGQAVSCAGSEEVRTPWCTLIMKGLSLPPPPPLRHTHTHSRTHSANRHGDGTSPALSPGGGEAGNIATLSNPPLAKLITNSYTSPPYWAIHRGYSLIKNTQHYGCGRNQHLTSPPGYERVTMELWKEKSLRIITSQEMEIYSGVTDLGH